MRQTRNRKEASPRVLSTFSGAGGLDLGLEAAGFSHLGIIENSPICLETLRLNRPTWHQLPWSDIHAAAKSCTPKHFGLKPGELDLLAGAPPCQPFSTAAQWSPNSRKGFQDDRAKTLLSFLTLAKKFLPKAILIENVPSFWSDSLGAKDEIEAFFNSLKAKGFEYNVQTAVLDASEFGVPQVRKRLILVATRDEYNFSWPKARFIDNPMTCWDALADVTPNSIPTPSGRWTPLLPSIPEGMNYQWHTSKGEGLEIFGYRTKFWSFLLKISKNKPSWTLAAQPGPSTGPFHWDNRPLAIEEMLALQTFPLNWQLAGGHREQVRMAGNATPPLLGELIARQIRKCLGYKPLRSQLKFLPQRSEQPPPLSKLSPVPEKFTLLAGEHKSHPGTGKGPRPRTLPTESPSK